MTQTVLIPVISSTILGMSHSEENKTMIVQFKTGSAYQYSDISFEEFNSIITDQSVGGKLRKVTKEKQFHKLN